MGRRPDVRGRRGRSPPASAAAYPVILEAPQDHDLGLGRHACIHRLLLDDLLHDGRKLSPGTATPDGAPERVGEVLCPLMPTVFGLGGRGLRNP
eukprot:1188069-Lingulodinium_polyedra.AAC.1